MITSKATLKFTAISLFPEMFAAVTEHGVVGRAIKNGEVDVDLVNPRDFTSDRHRTVDDRPYGGGPGMLMKVEPLEKAIESVKHQCPGKVIYLSPQGKQLNHKLVKQLSTEQHLILIAGRYEGIDERLLNKHVDLEVSLGDFVLSGGELGAMAIIDSVTRLLPGVLGHSDSAEEDSFSDGLLDHPHYTRPEVYEGAQVPKALLSGNHQLIADWRLQQRLGRTWLRRPELLAEKSLTQKEQQLLEEFQRNYSLKKTDLLD
ncbi:tRNA (guanosine(37)-N1)-methyltransferase TrmD [Aliikangiella marina]|uniref:tRNA (guanine-N(1)-)-methyltransferase n=1 Tax=Aliikangiella marina TaxID=1712262 RepID=A0A545TE58_9GAMM|nr:tRNA (guanosine(37)-N1)-methyltransferase TrmD [Aliikangiella marina]TQV75513.1 tRNA (guanosine(37)-N1)-methyltransferase TrmD [Aliikangiella marina]